MNPAALRALGLVALGALGLFGLRLATRPTRLRVFLSFAAEDAKWRDLFMAQTKNTRTPWDFADASLHAPLTKRWKTQVREHIRACDALIQLVGAKTAQAEGAIWEVECARAEGIPAFGVWFDAAHHGKLPSCFSPGDVIPWTWDGIQRELGDRTKK